MTRVRPRSMRVRALVVSIAVALLPLAFVALSAPIETGLQSRMEKRIAAALEDALRSNDWRSIALKHGVRLRTQAVDIDHDTQGWWARLGELLLGGDPPRDEGIDPEALQRIPRCGGDGVLVCAVGAVRDDGTIIYVTHSTRRPSLGLYDVRYQLVKLSLIMLPLAIALGLYLGWRMVRPIEELTARVRQSKALVLDRSDEIGDLSAAFAALTKRNEAFVADLAHEMKNPLAAIRAASEVVDDGSERARRLARILKDASGRLDAIVSQLLEIARVEAGLKERSDVALDALVRGIVSSRADASRITLRLAPAVVSGSAHHLESVVRNLLDNASAFGNNVCVRVMPGHLSVEDDGPGIPPDVLPRVFERFFTTRGERQGTGLGLALVKAIVEAHGGRVDVVSPISPSGGARFHIFFTR